MNDIKDEQMKIILSELAENLIHVYGKQLKEIILYGSVARGMYTKESDIDIMVLVDADNEELRNYSEKLSDMSTDISLKYLRVFSIKTAILSTYFRLYSFKKKKSSLLPAIEITSLYLISFLYYANTLIFTQKLQPPSYCLCSITNYLGYLFCIKPHFV